MARLYTKNAAQLFQKHVENEQEPKWGLGFQLRYQPNMALNRSAVIMRFYFSAFRAAPG
jgi:hypothetical protein